MLGDGPAPLILRQVLLATGERGLGWEAVQRITGAAEFARLEYVQRRLLQAATDDGRKAIGRERAEATALQWVAQPVPPLAAFDPETATPEERAAWLAAAKAAGY